jgi:hypothetical protein
MRGQLHALNREGFSHGVKYAQPILISHDSAGLRLRSALAVKSVMNQSTLSKQGARHGRVMDT